MIYDIPTGKVTILPEDSHPKTAEGDNLDMYTCGWHKHPDQIDPFYQHLCALKSGIIAKMDSETGVTFFENRETKKHFKFVQLPVDRVVGIYALDENTVACASKFSLFIVDAIEYKLKKQIYFKREMKAIFPISSRYIGTVTNTRIRIIDAYNGNVFCESFIPNAQFGSNVVMGMNHDTLFISSEGGKTTYMLRQIGMETEWLKNRDCFFDMNFWFHDEDHK
jgi:hypothetical protein